MTAADLIVACVLDLAIGDPHWLPHPVRLMGKTIVWYEARIRVAACTPSALRVAGIILAIGLPAMSYTIAWLAIELVGSVHPEAGRGVGIWLAFTTLAARDLFDHARAVARALQRGSLALARQAVSRIVGRDTDRLSEPEVVRATVETIAESTSDGVIAPLVYLALGGPPLALAYKAINTLDSMIGHRDTKYRDLGWASARFDDVANWIPARITGLLLVLAAGIWTRTMRQAWRMVRRDGGKHPSPNSGRPEAAMAGALGVQLGGTNVYDGKPSDRPRLGDALTPLRPARITTALGLMGVASLLAVGLAVVVLSR
ncbi:MAG: adenosylcobinamide-phosphate synthase CbiB [Nitrospiraceae bacterium]